MKVITVSNGSNEYPGNFTPEELQIIRYSSKGRVLNLFSGASTFGNIRIDFSHKNATHKMDVFTFLYETKKRFGTIIVDAPYNKRFANKYQLIGNTPNQFIIFANSNKTTELFEYIRELSPEILIIKSWNYYIPEGYKIKKSFLCYPGGYRKSTILLIFENREESDD